MTCLHRNTSKPTSYYICISWDIMGKGPNDWPPSKSTFLFMVYAKNDCCSGYMLLSHVWRWFFRLLLLLFSSFKLLLVQGTRPKWGLLSEKQKLPETDHVRSARILNPWVARISMNPPMMPFLGRSTHITITAAATTSIIVIVIIIILIVIIVVIIIIIQVPPCLLLKPTFMLIESTCLLVKSLFILFDEILDSSRRMHDYPPVNYQFTIENGPFVADLPWFTS